MIRCRARRDSRCSRHGERGVAAFRISILQTEANRVHHRSTIRRVKMGLPTLACPGAGVGDRARHRIAGPGFTRRPARRDYMCAPSSADGAAQDLRSQPDSVAGRGRADYCSSASEGRLASWRRPAGWAFWRRRVGGAPAGGAVRSLGGGRRACRPDFFPAKAARAPRGRSWARRARGPAGWGRGARLTAGDAGRTRPQRRPHPPAGCRSPSQVYALAVGCDAGVAWCFPRHRRPAMRRRFTTGRGFSQKAAVARKTLRPIADGMRLSMRAPTGTLYVDVTTPVKRASSVGKLCQ